MPTAKGPNIETDLYVRIANLEAACFVNGINNGSQTPIWQGANQTPVNVYKGTAEAIAYPGVAILAKTSAEACTLVAPIAGPASAGGDDGKSLVIRTATNFAHTVTTPAHAIVDGTGTTKDTVTFAAEAGGSIELKAYNGSWLQVATPVGVTLTEV